MRIGQMIQQPDPAYIPLVVKHTKIRLCRDDGRLRVGKAGIRRDDDKRRIIRLVTAIPVRIPPCNLPGATLVRNRPRFGPAQSAPERTKTSAKIRKVKRIDCIIEPFPIRIEAYSILDPIG